MQYMSFSFKVSDDDYAKMVKGVHDAFDPEMMKGDDDALDDEDPNDLDYLPPSEDEDEFDENVPINLPNIAVHLRGNDTCEPANSSSGSGNQEKSCK